jgi:hypothetical protein
MFAETAAENPGVQRGLGGEDEPVVEVGQFDGQRVGEGAGDAREAVAPGEARGAEEVEDGQAAGGQSACCERWNPVPGGSRLFDLAVGGDGQVLEDDVEAAATVGEPVDGVAVVAGEGFGPGGMGGGEEVEAAGVEVDAVDSGGAVEGAEGGDGAAAAEAEEGDFAGRVGEEAGGGEDVEDAVGGAGEVEDLAEDGSVLGEAPTAGGATDPDGRIATGGGAVHAPRQRRVDCREAGAGAGLSPRRR